MTGHMLGAAGAVEAMFSALALQDGFIPATIHYAGAGPGVRSGRGAQSRAGSADVRYALSNSLGFGGHNGSILLKKWEA